LSWFLPEQRRKKIKKWEKYVKNKEVSIVTKKKLLYKILSPSLDWVRDALRTQCNLEQEEAESEIFLLCNTLIEEFDPNKRLLYYIETRTPWKVSELLNRLSPPPEDATGLEINLGTYCIEEEIWPSIPKFLFETRWLAKNLSIYEKAIILTLLTLEAPSCRQIAQSLGVSKTSINEDLQIIAGKMKGRL